MSPMRRQQLTHWSLHSQFIHCLLFESSLSLKSDSYLSHCPLFCVWVGQNGLVKFYQSWCGHCTRMKPDWDRLAEEAPPSVFIHDVNCGDEPDLCKDNGVTGYPTIKYYLNGEDHKYEGGRGFDPLMTFVSETLQQKCDVTKLKETCNDKAQTYAEKVSRDLCVNNVCLRILYRKFRIASHSFLFPLSIEIDNRN